MSWTLFYLAGLYNFAIRFIRGQITIK